MPAEDIRVAVILIAVRNHRIIKRIGARGFGRGGRGIECRRAECWIELPPCREHAFHCRAQGREPYLRGGHRGAADLLRLGRGLLVLGLRRSVASGKNKNNSKRGGAREETRRHGNDLQPGASFRRGKGCLQSRWMRRNAIQRRTHARCFGRLSGYAVGYRGEQIGFDRQPGSRSGRPPVCHAPINCWKPERGRRSGEGRRGNATELFGAIERNALARHLFHGRWMVFHRHIRAAIAGRGFRRTHTS